MQSRTFSAGRKKSLDSFSLDKIKPLRYLLVMTIKNRNRFFLFLFIFSSAVFLCEMLVFCLAAAAEAVVAPENPVRTFVLFKSGFLCPYSFHASAAAIILFGLSAPVLSMAVFKGFEKTPSLEILFFSGFILSCLAESSRLLLPVFGLWKTNSLLLIVLGRIVIGGRILAPLSLFFAAAFSSADDLQNAERNLIILLTATCTFAILYPMNTSVTTSSCTVLWGFRHLLTAVRTLIFLTTILSAVIEAHSKGIREIYAKAAGLLVLAAGYGLLCGTDCWLEFCIALVLSAAGWLIYLKSIHYIANMWT